MTSSKLKTVIC